MIFSALWFLSSVFQRWAWPRRKSKGEAWLSGGIHSSSERKRETGTFCGISQGGGKAKING
jgi:hypothetical protein